MSAKMAALVPAGWLYFKVHFSVFQTKKKHIYRSQLPSSYYKMKIMDLIKLLVCDVTTLKDIIYKSWLKMVD